MYLGHIVEIAGRDEIYSEPLHPYSRALLSAVPIPDPIIDTERARIPLTGEVPSPLICREDAFSIPVCQMATAECRQAMPELREVKPDHWSACIHAPGYGSR